jgi:hypothetical protein
MNRTVRTSPSRWLDIQPILDRATSIRGADQQDEEIVWVSLFWITNTAVIGSFATAASVLPQADTHSPTGQSLGRVPLPGLNPPARLSRNPGLRVSLPGRP